MASMTPIVRMPDGRARFAGVALAVVCCAAGAPAGAQTVNVKNADGLRRAAAAARPGTRIHLEAGEYPGGFSFEGLKGEPGKPIIIAGADPRKPPVLSGGQTGMHFTDAAHIELRNLVIEKAGANGLNIDDGGSYGTPAHHITLSGIQVRDIGPQGNRDGIKLSGVDDFRVENCSVERWGTGGGSGIDMVGCHRGVIEGNFFRHTDTQGSTGVQAKGGSSSITIRANRFESAGGRAINIGGSTGLAYFRPPLEAGAAGERCEAKDIVVEGNVFIGGGAAAAFVGVDGAVVRFNTVYRPVGWAFRILQENNEAGFVPSRKGEITDNLFVFRSGEWKGAVNIGPKTAPETFKFARNAWYSMDRPDRSRPQLPSPEEGGLLGQDPLFIDADNGDFRVRPASPASKVGAQSLPESRARQAARSEGMAAGRRQSFDPLRPTGK